MLDRVKSNVWKKTKKNSELLPLHKTIISTFSNIEKVLIDKLLENQEIQKTKRETKNIILELLDYENNEENILDKEKKSYLIKVIKILRELYKDNKLFYSQLPNWWEDYLKNSVQEILSSMKNKDYLTQLFEIVINKIKSWEKIKFIEILNSITTNKSSKYELHKILVLLREKYNIDFIKVSGLWCILKINDFAKKTDLLDNIEEIKKSFNRIKDRNWITMNILIKDLLSFIEEIVLKRNLNEFTQHELVMYCLKNNPEIDIWIIRTFIKNNLFKGLLEQWVIIQVKSNTTYDVKFNKNINDSYNKKFFTNLNKNPLIRKIFDEAFEKLLEKTTNKNKEIILKLKDEFIELNSKWDFFILKSFLEKYNFDKWKIVRLNVVLKELINNWVIWRKWRERYYIYNKDSIKDTDKFKLFKFIIFLSKFSIEWETNNFHNKILFYIFKDIWDFLDINEINSDDLSINIDIFWITLLFKKNKFAKYQNNILLICDEISEEKSVNIYPRFIN